MPAQDKLDVCTLTKPPRFPRTKRKLARVEERQSCLWDLNPGPRPYQGRALPTEPRQHCPHTTPHYLTRPAASAFAAFPISLFRTPRMKAGDGNRTHVACLEGRYSTIELHPRFLPSSRPFEPSPTQSDATWVEQDSNLRRQCHQIYSLAPLAAWVSTRNPRLPRTTR